METVGAGGGRGGGQTDCEEETGLGAHRRWAAYEDNWVFICLFIARIAFDSLRQPCPPRNISCSVVAQWLQRSSVLRRVQGTWGHVPCSFLTSKRSKRVCCAAKETPWPALLSCAQKQSVGGRNCEPLCLRVAAGRRAPGCSKEPMRTMH